MNIDLVSVKKDMRRAVTGISPSATNMERKYTGSAIISSISFSSMLENALRQELSKDAGK